MFNSMERQYNQNTHIHTHTRRNINPNECLWNKSVRGTAQRWIHKTSIIIPMTTLKSTNSMKRIDFRTSVAFYLINDNGQNNNSHNHINNSNNDNKNDNTATTTTTINNNNNDNHNNRKITLCTQYALQKCRGPAFIAYMSLSSLLFTWVDVLCACRFVCNVFCFCLFISKITFIALANCLC